MLKFTPLFLLIGFALEIASIIWVGRAVGVIATLLLLAGGVVAGVTVFRTAGMSVATALRAPVRDPKTQRGLAGRTLFRVVSGLLFVVPGFFSDVFAVLLLFPPLQTWLITRMKFATVAARGGPFSQDEQFRTIVDVEAVEIEGEIMPPDGSGDKR